MNSLGVTVLLIFVLGGSVALVDPVSASPAPSEAPAPSLSAQAPVAAGPRALNGGSLSPSTASNFTTLLTYLQTTQRFSLFYNLTQLAPAVGQYLGTGNVTLLLPTNDAMIAFYDGLLAQQGASDPLQIVNDGNQNVFQEIVLRHILADPVDFYGNVSLRTTSTLPNVPLGFSPKDVLSVVYISNSTSNSSSGTFFVSTGPGTTAVKIPQSFISINSTKEGSPSSSRSSRAIIYEIDTVLQPLAVTVPLQFYRAFSPFGPVTTDDLSYFSSFVSLIASG